MRNCPPRSAKITRFVGEDDFDLCLRIGELIDLSEVRDCGPSLILQRLQTNNWYVQDITETVRLALIGGGMPQYEAKKLVNRSIKEGYLQVYMPVALECLFAALTGIEDQPDDEVVEEPGEPLTPEI